MICPNCHAEFRPGFTVCSDCGIALVEALPGGDEAGAESLDGALEPFHETWSSDELAAILELFEEHRLPYVVQAGTALSRLTPSAMQAVEVPEEWHARILVPAGAFRRAQELLRELRQALRDANAGASREDRGALS
jgi:hypothetical protein